MSKVLSGVHGSARSTVKLFCLIILGKISFSWWLPVATARGELEIPGLKYTG